MTLSLFIQGCSSTQSLLEASFFTVGALASNALSADALSEVLNLEKKVEDAAIEKFISKFKKPDLIRKIIRISRYILKISAINHLGTATYKQVSSALGKGVVLGVCVTGIEIITLQESKKLKTTNLSTLTAELALQILTALTKNSITSFSAASILNMVLKKDEKI